MKYLLSILFATLLLLADKTTLSLDYTSLSYQNSPTNHFFSLSLDTEKIYTFQAGDVELRMGAKALGIFAKSDDFDLFDASTKSRAMIQSFSLDYYPSSQLLLSVGRESMDLNLLRGSFDGLLAVGSGEDFSLKAFYFKHYSTLTPSYYKNAKLDALYGFNFNYNKGMLESEISHFTYYGHTVNNLYMALHTKAFTAGAEYLSFTSDLLADEKAYKFHLGYQQGYFYGEVGYYHVYEGTLRNIFALGSSAFKHYRLHSFLDQPGAKELYLNLGYKQEGFYADLYLGHTQFEAAWDPNQTYAGKALGLTLGKMYKNFGLSATLLTQKSDQPWREGERTTWVQTQLKYRF